MGLEPMTPCLEGKCSIQLSYRGEFIYKNKLLVLEGLEPPTAALLAPCSTN